MRTYFLDPTQGPSLKFSSSKTFEFIPNLNTFWKKKLLFNWVTSIEIYDLDFSGK